MNRSVMVLEKLPDKIVELDQIRINRSLDKICTCKKRKFVMDTTNRRVICSSCGVQIDPHEAMLELAFNGERLKDQVNRLLEQQKQLANYKPWLVAVRRIEKKYRGKKMLPNCPRCDEPFYLEELVFWTGKEFAEKRIRTWKGENQE